MSRPTVLPSSVPLCSVLFLTLATQCLAFPKVEKTEVAHAYAQTGQSRKMNTGDRENISSAPEHMPQQTSSEAPMVLSARPSVMPFNKVFSVNQEHHLPGANIPDLHSSTEPAISATEQGHGPSQLEGISSEQRLPKALSIIAVSSPASLIPHQEGPQSSSSTQPIVEGITVVTGGFLKYVDNQLFATESQEAVSLGNTPSSYINTKEMLTASPRTEKAETDAAKRTTAFPGVGSTADTEADAERPSEEPDDNVQTTATTHVETTPEDVLNTDPTADSLLGDLKVTVSVGTAVPVSSALRDEWDDTKFESASQARTTDSGDHAETRVRTEPPHGAYESFVGTEGSPASTALNKVAPLGTALVTALEQERSPVFAHQIPFSPMSLTEDPKGSTVKLLPSAGGFTASTVEDRTMLFSKTEVSTSQYESQTHQGVGDVLKDITQEMTTAIQEPDPTIPLVTQEHIEVPRGSGEPEDGMPSPSPVSADVGATELYRRWESLASPASTTVVPLSLEVTSSMEDLMDTITGPNKEFIPVLGSPEAPPAMAVETPTISPALPSEGRTISPINHPNTAASYGLEQLESEELEDEDEEEDEEDEDEEEEDEEEDEEDKEADSLYKDFDSDTELPGFTLPGITSQEPDVEAGSMALLEVATYQVPETMEWEQQNQGLVRSWMEKLKDKAGYMSGMLVPVGVGIAGALFILGALYSIKVMNRRRRNGFKRHKRKQKEFNSMQDRVMLLADSSEDEF